MSNPTPEHGPVPPDQPHSAAAPPPPDHTTEALPGEPAQPAGPSNFMVALNDQFAVMLRLLKGETLPGFQIAARSPLMWLVTLVVGGLLLGLFFATTLGRISGAAMSSVASMFGGGSVYFGMTGGAWFTVFLTTVIVLAIVMLLRAAAVHLTFQMGGKPQPFRESLAVLATAYTLHLPVLLVLLLLVLIPGATWVTILMVIGVFLWGLFYLLAELLIYIGLNRTTGFAKSPFRPHAIATGVWMIASAIVYFLAMLIVGEIAANSLGGML